MSVWTAILPLKFSEDRKSRLASVLSLEERRELSDHMAEKVFAELRTVEAVGDIILLSPFPLTDWPVRHLADQGRGLNAELNEVALTIPEPLLVIHGDLPLISADDISALLDAAQSKGAAIAPDRHRQGTNALALWERPPAFTFAFGPNSFALHRQRLCDTLAVVQRKGLACDVDTPNDLAHAQTLKYTL